MSDEDRGKECKVMIRDRGKERRSGHGGGRRRQVGKELVMEGWDLWKSILKGTYGRCYVFGAKHTNHAH